MVSNLHEERLNTVVHYLLESGATRVLDLGCGSGELLQRLARQPQFTCLVGIDIDQNILNEARLCLGLSIPPHPGDRVQVRHGSFDEADDELTGFDAAALVETIEHIDPRRLTRVELAVFGKMRPRTVLVTTPNQEFNILYGMTPHQLRNPGHHFEWNRVRFQQWAQGIAARNGYEVCFIDIGPADPLRGSSTQMAHFTLLA